jgi:predicted metal-dependent hydrolase
VPENKRSIALKIGQRSVPCERVNSRRDAKRLSIRVCATGKVIVRAPKRVSLRFVRDALESHAGWIERQLRRIDQQLRENPLPRYRSGDFHDFLGRSLRLEVQASPGAAGERVQRQGMRLVVRSEGGPEQVRALLHGWYLRQARHYLARRLETLARRVPWAEQVPPLRVRAMRRQWGSCSSTGRISLNAWLITAPLRCIDYVILHELCHLRELNHSPRFYRLLEGVMPEWRAVKAELDRVRMVGEG